MDSRPAVDPKPGRKTESAQRSGRHWRPAPAPPLASAGANVYGIVDDMAEVERIMDGLMMRPAIDGVTVLPPDAAADGCPLCFGALQRGLTAESVCLECGYVRRGDTTEGADDDDEADRRPAVTGRLRLVGANSGLYAPDLCRSSVINQAEVQKKQVLDDFRNYCRRYSDRGGRSFPEQAFEIATERYSELQKNGKVMRSQIKRVVMAELLREACIRIGFSPRQGEVAAMMELPHQGTSRGGNIIRKMVADGKMTEAAGQTDGSAQQVIAEIQMFFAYLNVSDADAKVLMPAAKSIVDMTDSLNICTQSKLRSRAAGAVFITLGRRPGAEAMGLTEFCDRGRIRKNTVDKVVDDINRYHTLFVPVYAAAGLTVDHPV
jgi:hypothetical protein